MEKVFDQLDYDRKLALSVERGVTTVGPLTASIAINDGCNSKCAYCLIWKHDMVNTELNDLKNVIDQLGQLGVYVISLTGGEPFLHSELSLIVAHAREHGIIVS